jgi:hypothetical protein
LPQTPKKIIDTKKMGTIRVWCPVKWGNFIAPFFPSFSFDKRVASHNFIKGGKFDILLAPHYNTVKKNVNKKIRLLFFFILILTDIGILLI